MDREAAKRRKTGSKRQQLDMKLTAPTRTKESLQHEGRRFQIAAQSATKQARLIERETTYFGM